MKKNQKKLSSLLLGAAIAGLMAGTSTLTSCTDNDSTPAERNGCGGANGCGSKGEKQESNGCNGHNGCAGKTEEKDRNGCNGHNGCNGQGASDPNEKGE